MTYLKPAELLKVLQAAKDKSARDFCLILLGYKSGLRASEICRLTLDDVRGGYLDVQRLKGSLHTRRPLQHHANPLLDEIQALAEYIKERGDADGSRILFISRNGSGLTRRAVYNLFEDAAFKAGVEAGRRNPHILKHSLSTHMRHAGMGIELIRIALGHRDLKATACYLSVTSEEAGAAVDRTMAIFA
jgi:site-specific recombinase XerD